MYGSFNRNVYILLLFTLGKGFQLSIGALTLNLYVHSLGYNLEFVGIFAATSAIGALLAAVQVGNCGGQHRPQATPSHQWLHDATDPGHDRTQHHAALPLLISSILNGLVASAYWVTYLPILTDSTTEEKRVAAMALNNFLLLGVGVLGALIGGGVPQIIFRVFLHQSPQDVVPLRWGILVAALIVFLPALPLLSMHVPRKWRPVYGPPIPGRQTSRGPRAIQNRAGVRQWRCLPSCSFRISCSRPERARS